MSCRQSRFGRVDIGHLDLAHDMTVGSDDGDVARDQRGNRDIARASTARLSKR